MAPMTLRSSPNPALPKALRKVRPYPESGATRRAVRHAILTVPLSETGSRRLGGGHAVRAYAAMITAMDDQIGRIVSALEKRVGFSNDPAHIKQRRHRSEFALTALDQGGLMDFILKLGAN
jgi:hypothetical protein